MFCSLRNVELHRKIRRDNNHGHSSAQGEISGIKTSSVDQIILGHFKPEEISLMLPSFFGGAENDVNHFAAVLEDAKQDYYSLLHTN